MIFADLIYPKLKEAEEEIYRLIDLAFINQARPNDLLLILLNTAYKPGETSINERGEIFPVDPHNVGPQKEGHSEETHYRFISYFRKSHTIEDKKYDDYKKFVEYDPNRIQEIDKHVGAEQLSVHVEMLVYLKIWESDLFIKRLYQFIRILNKEPIDWHFKIKDANRSNGKTTGKKQEILFKKIINPLKNHSPKLYALFTDAYITQVRNAIAHSQFAMIGRNINLNNQNLEDQYSLEYNIEFDKWVDIFNNTLAIYNAYILMINTIWEKYIKISESGNGELIITLNNTEGKEYNLTLLYDSFFKNWTYKQ